MTVQPSDVQTAGFIPGRLNIIMYPGVAWSLPLEWNDASEQPMNLAGYTARVIWSDPPPRSKIPPAPAVVFGTTSPNMILTLTAAQTTGVSFRALGYQLYVTSPDGAELPWLEGVVTLGGTGR